MTREYTLDKMIESVSSLFAEQGFLPEPYSKRLYNIRLPLDCVKWKDGKKDGEIEEEAVIDIITETHISKDAYLPDKHYGKFLVRNASSVKFFQYYLHQAKVFWAYGHYAEANPEFDEFKKCCADNGIGLIEVSDSGAQIVQEPMSLDDIVRKRVEDLINKTEELNKEAIIDSLTDLSTDLQDEYIQYLVFYGEPRFTRREITERYEEDLSNFLSTILVNKLGNVKNIDYSQLLRDWANNYRHETDNDHQIALRVIKEWWEARFGIDYPDIHKDFEVVLLLDENYRDHFLHQFQVFLLGALIIDQLYNEPWVGAFENLYGSKIEDVWLACSTYHDYNYPVQKWDDWMKRFLAKNFHISNESGQRHLDHEVVGKEIMQFHVEKIVIRDEFISKMARICTAIGCDFDDNFERFVLQRVAADKNHAALGAFTFLEKFGDRSSLKKLALDQAAASIFIHDEPNWQSLRGDGEALKICSEKEKLSYEEEQMCKTPSPVLEQLTLEPDSMPLAFLLAFCDVAQEWGRRGEGWEIEKPRLEEIQINEEGIHIHISVLNDTSYDRKEKEVTRLGRYLKDARFAIRVSSREGQRDTTIRMSGT